MQTEYTHTHTHTESNSGGGSTMHSVVNAIIVRAIIALKRLFKAAHAHVFFVFIVTGDMIGHHVELIHTKHQRQLVGGVVKLYAKHFQREPSVELHATFQLILVEGFSRCSKSRLSEQLNMRSKCKEHRTAREGILLPITGATSLQELVHLLDQPGTYESWH